MKLRPYQVQTLERLKAELLDGKNRLLVKSPTGTGKTVTFAAILQDPGFRGWLETYPATERKMLVIAHREELLEQAAQKIHAANPGLRVGIEQGDRVASRACDVVVASIQTLQATDYRRLDRLTAHHRFRVVIVDEAHHAAAMTYRTVLAKLGFIPLAEPNVAKTWRDAKTQARELAEWDTTASQDQVLIGVTATPNRKDAAGLSSVFQTIAFSYDLRQAILDRWLVPITAWTVETDTDLDDVRTMNTRDFNQRELAAAVNQEKRNQLAVAAWEEYAQGRYTIAFTVDVAHAHNLAAAFEAIGVDAVAVSGETPKDLRRQYLRAFQEGRIQLLANCMVLTEGTDLPRCDAILHAAPTQSGTLYEQRTGRGLRLFEGKEDCVVIDVVDVTRKHSLATAPTLYGLPAGIMAQGAQLEDAAAFVEEALELFPNLDIGAYEHITLAELRARVETVDLWTLPDLGDAGKGLKLRWVRTDVDVYRLQYPWEETNEHVIVRRDLLDRFEVALTARLKDDKHAKVDDRTIIAGLADAHEALRVAEGFVAKYRSSVWRMKAAGAPWRSKPASEKQIALLKKLRAPIREGLTAGEASDFIDARRIVTQRQKAWKRGAR